MNEKQTTRLRGSGNCQRARGCSKWREVTGGVPYITFTISFGLLVDMAAYGLMVPVLPFRLESIGYHNIPAKSSYRTLYFPPFHLSSSTCIDFCSPA